MKHYVTPLLLQSLIDLNHSNRDKFPEGHHNFYHMHTYLRELGTVQINLGRQIGHTTCIAQLAKPWDIIITPTLLMRDHVMRLESAAKVIPLSWVQRSREFVYRNIFIDCASSITPRDMQHIYETLGVQQDQTFILVG